MFSLILLIGLILRLVILNQSLWLDEAININIVKSVDLNTIIFKYALGDFHPPLYHVILKGWAELYLNILHLPEYEFVYRLPSVIFGVLTIYVLYLIGKKLFNKQTALIAAALLATSPLHIYYSQEARMYMLATFLTSLSVYFFVSIIKKDKLVYWLGFIVSTGLMLYSDYLPYFIIPAYVLYLLINYKKISKTTLKAFVPALLLIGALITPWLILLPSQLKAGLSAAAASPAWAQVVGTPNFHVLGITFVKFVIGRVSIENHLAYALVLLPVGIFVSALLILSLLRSNNKRSFLYYWFLLPVVLSFGFAFVIPIFAYFRLTYVLPAYYLLLASAITVVNFPPLIRTLLTVTIVINVVPLFFYFTNPQFQREDWRGATNYIVSQWTPRTTVLFESNYTTGPFDYYNKNRLDAHGALDSFDAGTSNIRGNIEKYTAGKQKVYLFQYLSGITDPQGLLFSQLNKSGFINTKTTDFNGVGFIYEFTK